MLGGALITAHNRGLMGHADRCNAEFPSKPHEDRLHRRVQMEMVVAVDMIEAETGSAERRQLSPDLRLRLRLRTAAEKDSRTEADGVARDPTVGSDQIRDPPRRQRR